MYVLSFNWVFQQCIHYEQNPRKFTRITWYFGWHKLKHFGTEVINKVIWEMFVFLGNFSLFTLSLSVTHISTALFCHTYIYSSCARNSRMQRPFRSIWFTRVRSTLFLAVTNCAFCLLRSAALAKLCIDGYRCRWANRFRILTDSFIYYSVSVCVYTV